MVAEMYVCCLQSSDVFQWVGQGGEGYFANRTAIAEERFSNASSDSERLMKVYKEEKVSVNMNTETIRRYISVARRLNSQPVLNILNLWEFKFKRNTLVDNITVLRTCVSVASDDDQLAYILQTLFMDQVCGLRTTVKNSEQMTYTHQLKAILLRRNVLLHLYGTFPKLQEEVQKFVTMDAYTYLFGYATDGHCLFFISHHHRIKHPRNPSIAIDVGQN